jgi:iron complex outermembrane recepter protein
MSKNTLLRRAIRLALANAAAASVALPLAAMADDATGPADPAPQAAPASAPQPALQEVVVTGSRIVQPGLKSISPVTAISAKEIASQGTTSIEDILNSLPQVVASQGAMLSNGATGTATVDLRGLGPQRTLVLINGRRLMPGDATNNSLYANAADLDNIPVGLVERVDVLTGGASAVYGADAVAGVVNFVMNDHFQGFEVDVNGSAYQHDQHSYFGQFSPASGFGSAPSSVMDGATKDVTFIMGGNFADNKGNATAYVEYRKTSPVLEAARDFSRCTLSGANCSGSSTAEVAKIYAAGFLPSNPSAPDFFKSPFLAVNPATQTLVPWTSSDAFNYGALNYYMRPDERWNAGAFTHYNIDDNHQVYSEFMLMNDETDAQIAPSGMFIGSGTGVNPNTGNPDGDWTVNCSNPYLSSQEATTIGCTAPGPGSTQDVQVLMGRRNFEGGNRSDLLTHTSYRFVIGSKGQINDNLSYDVYAQEGVTLHSEEYENDVSKSRLSQALLAVTDPTTGQVVCAANANGGGGAPGCVPYNIWGTGPVSQQAISYFSVPGLIEGKTEERVYHADLTSDLSDYVKLPTASEGLGLNFGAEYREEFMELRPDQEFITADLAGQGSATLPLSAGYGVKEGFVEARLPLIQDKPFAKEVSLDVGYRYSKYDVGYTTNTYKFGVDWSPDSQIRFRGGYNRAVRAPNIAELFAERFVALDGSVDPCASSSGSPASSVYGVTASQCARSGLSSALFNNGQGTPGNPAGQYNGLIGGNPKLKPEIADTYSFGIVLTPTMLPSFSATVDVFDIKIKDLISSYGANLIVNQCVYDDNPTFCSMVHRDSAGSLWFSTNGYVDDPLLNLGYEKENGADVSLNYTQSVGPWGSVNFNLIGTYTASFDTEPYPGSGDYNCAGYFGDTCGNPLPKWKHTMTVGWATPWHGLGLEARWRHFGNTEIELANPSPLLAGSFKSYLQYTGSRDYLDLIGTDQIFSGVQLQVGINNVLDKDPPILPTTSFGAAAFNGNTYPQVYDTLGRLIFANLKIDF